MKILLDPKIFNYLIMMLYGLNAARWALERKIAARRMAQEVLAL